MLPDVYCASMIFKPSSRENSSKKIISISYFLLGFSLMCFVLHIYILLICPQEFVVKISGSSSNEWFLEGIKLYGSISKEIFEPPYLFSTTAGFTLFFPLFDIWVSFQVFCPALVPWIFKNTKSEFSTTHSTCRQRRKLLSTGYSSVHSITVAPPKSLRIEKCRGHQQATREFGDSYSSLPTGPCLSQSYLIYRKDFI